MAVPPSLRDTHLDESKADLKNESLSKKSLQMRILNSLLRVGFALAIATVIFQLKLDYIESYFYDLRFRFLPSAKTSGLIDLIQVKNSTINTLNGAPKISHYTKLIKKLVESKPSKILLNIDLSKIEGTEIEKSEFVNLAKKVSQLHVITDNLVMKGKESQLKLPSPYSEVSAVSGPISIDAANFAKDGVTRRMLLEYQGRSPIHVEIASEYNSDMKDIKKIRGGFDFLEAYQTYIHFHPTGSYPTYIFEKVMDGDVPTAEFRNKIIIIGRDLATDDNDYSLTPFSRDVMAMTRTEVHANMIDTLIFNNAPIKAPNWLNYLFIALISILTVHVVLLLKPLNGLLILVSTLIGFSFFSFIVFWALDFWINMAQPLIAIFLSYYFFIPYRLIMENRRSWEYYQKNKLLKQVEELKTNFISMMSHDLKTPIARIQGMTDVILSGTTSLSSQQREAIDTIKQSSNDLLKFINSILNYGKIESQGVELHLQTKDINMLLEDVIKKHEFLAKLKRIQIVKELEPLFPVELDPELISQVFSNLVENAIKYSPEDTKIMVTSEEGENGVVVQVSDQGPGIPADELSNIFMKFFRSKNAKSSPIKGSGLGLYLAKYFIELHNGRVFVESSIGQGSTFIVEIPMEQRREHA